MWCTMPTKPLMMLRWITRPSRQVSFNSIYTRQNWELPYGDINHNLHRPFNLEKLTQQEGCKRKTYLVDHFPSRI